MHVYMICELNRGKYMVCTKNAKSRGLYCIKNDKSVNKGINTGKNIFGNCHKSNTVSL